MTLARSLISIMALSAAAAVFTGCDNVPKKKYQDLEKEAMQIRERNEQLERQLADAETEKARLQNELDGVKANAAQVSTVPPSGVSPTGSDSSGQPGDQVISIAGDVLFSSGSTTIKNDAKKILDKVADELNGRYSGNRIRIAGHTDTDPLRKTKTKFTDNENLSAQRALAVERYLSSKGVDSKRMYSAAFGSDAPRGSKKDSRRVEIVILAAGNS